MVETPRRGLLSGLMGGGILLSSTVAFLELFSVRPGVFGLWIHIALEVLVAWVSEELEMRPQSGVRLK